MAKAGIVAGPRPPAAKRKHWSLHGKRRIIAPSLVAGANVFNAARAYDVHANPVVLWRRLYRSGLLEMAAGITNLLPVQAAKGEPAFTSRHPASSRRAATALRLPGSPISVAVSQGWTSRRRRMFSRLKELRQASPSVDSS